MTPTADIQIRDPFVVVHEGRYHLFGTTDPLPWTTPERRFMAWTSADLERWDGPHPVFTAGDAFFATGQFWAPEVHRYDGRWLMLASFKAGGASRCTTALVADQLLGPYRPVTQTLTPPGWECLDGTLHVEADGTPWLVFCHEWLQVADGHVCAVPLDRACAVPTAAPITLFTASQAPWTGVSAYDKGIAFARVTDGPFLHRTADGTLLLLWSSYKDGSYCLGVARSESGSIRGPWRHEPLPLVAGDAGHGMVFRDLHGDLRLSLHRPNQTPKERPVFLRLVERGSRLELA